MAVFLLDTRLGVPDLVDEVWKRFHKMCMVEVCTEIRSFPSVVEAAVMGSNASNCWDRNQVINQQTHFDDVIRRLRRRRKYDVRVVRGSGVWNYATLGICISDDHFFVFARDKNVGRDSLTQDFAVEVFIEKQEQATIVKIERYWGRFLATQPHPVIRRQILTVQESLEDLLEDKWRSQHTLLNPGVRTMIVKLARLKPTDVLRIDSGYNSGKSWINIEDVMMWRNCSSELPNDHNEWPFFY